MTTKTEARIVTDPSGQEWKWWLRSDGRYQVTSVEVPTYGFALTNATLRATRSESMAAVYRDVVIAEERQCEWMLLCEAPAADLVAHPVLNLVATCQHCVDTFRLETFLPRRSQ